MAGRGGGQQKSSPWDGIVQVLKTFLPAISVFAALIYFFGRLYVEAYYYALGITPEVLVFTTQDVMFFSFNMVIMCLVFTILFYMCWEWLISNEEKGNTPFTLQGGRQAIIVCFIILLFILSGLYYCFIHIYPELYVTGLAGLCIGLFFGISLVLVVIIIYILITKTPQESPTSKKPRKLKMALENMSRKYLHDQLENPIIYPSKKSFIFLTVLGVLIVLSFMPSITADLAGAQADSDIREFPDVRVVAEEDFPEEIQELLPGDQDYLDGRLLLENAGIVYVMKLFKVPRGTDCRSVKDQTGTSTETATLHELKMPGGDFTVHRQVYAIPMESIKDIIYYSR